MSDDLRVCVARWKCGFCDNVTTSTGYRKFDLLTDMIHRVCPNCSNFEVYNFWLKCLHKFKLVTRLAGTSLGRCKLGWTSPWSCGCCWDLCRCSYCWSCWRVYNRCWDGNAVCSCWCWHSKVIHASHSRHRITNQERDIKDNSCVISEIYTSLRSVEAANVEGVLTEVLILASSGSRLDVCQVLLVKGIVCWLEHVGRAGLKLYLVKTCWACRCSSSRVCCWNLSC